MPSLRNVLLLVLASGLGILAFLFAKGPLLRPDPALAGEGVVVARTTATGEGRAASTPDTGAGRPGAIEFAKPGGTEDVGARGSGAGTTVIWPLEVELLLALPGSVEAPSDALPIKSGANAGIRGQVRGPGGRPVAATILFVHGPNEGRTLTTDSRGRFGASDLWQGISIVRVTAGGATVERETRLAQLNTTEFNISFANPSFVSGTVKDQRGVVVEGAEVRLDGRLAYTDIEGRFTFSSVPAGTVLATVRKKGFATERRAVGVGIRSNVLAENFVIQLSESAAIELSVGSRVGASESSYAILMPAAGPGTTIAAGNYPWYEVNPVEIPLGGRALVDDLPAESVNVRVFHRGALGRPRSTNVRLYPGQTTPAVLNLEPAPTIGGRVLENGKPAGGVTVELEAADRAIATTKGLEQKNPRVSLQFVLPRVPTASDTTRTDSKGRFQFTSHPDLVTTYYITATSSDKKRRGVGVIRPSDKEVTISLQPIVDDSGELSLELPGRFQGLPVEVTVNGTPRDRFELRPGEPLVVDGLERGTWRVRATWRGADVVTRRVVEIGGKPAEIEGSLPRAALEGQTKDERERAAQRAY